jgi:predicted type IV restriction endonuclease
MVRKNDSDIWTQNTLLDVIKKIGDKIRDYRTRGQSMGEEETKSKLITPILRALGWDVEGDDVVQEYSAGKGSRVDYALKVSQLPALFLEAKPLGWKLAEDKGIDQVLFYAWKKGKVKWAVLTDGDQYRLYYTGPEVHHEDRLFCETQISKDTTEKSASMLALFSRQNMQDKNIETSWNAHHVDQQVRKAILDMLTNSDKSLVHLIHKRVPAVKPKEIAEAIMRLGVRIDPPLSPICVSPHTSTPKTKKPDHDRRVSLNDLIAAGLLKAPLRLFGPYKKQTLEAKLLPTGEVEFQNQRYTSPSAAGAAASQTITGRKMSMDGWTFWQVQGDDGKPRTLWQIRDAYAKRG